jgi:hypothetical protein
MPALIARSEARSPFWIVKPARNSFTSTCPARGSGASRSHQMAERLLGRPAGATDKFTCTTWPSGRKSERSPRPRSTLPLTRQLLPSRPMGHVSSLVWPIRRFWSGKSSPKGKTPSLPLYADRSQANQQQRSPKAIGLVCSSRGFALLSTCQPQHRELDRVAEVPADGPTDNASTFARLRHDERPRARGAADRQQAQRSEGKSRRHVRVELCGVVAPPRRGECAGKLRNPSETRPSSCSG